MSAMYLLSWHTTYQSKQTESESRVVNGEQRRDTHTSRRKQKYIDIRGLMNSCEARVRSCYIHPQKYMT
jgi:hypothetical protein